MTENIQESSIQIDFSDEAYNERLALSIERLSEFDIKGASPLFLCCRDIYNKDNDSPIVNNDSLSINPKKPEKYKTISGEKDKENSEGIYKKSDIESAAERIFYCEFLNVPKLRALSRTKDITIMLETLIQLELAILSGADEEEKLDIVYSYIYDYTEEFTMEYAETGHGILHISDAITPFGIIKGYEELLALVFGDRLKAEKKRAIEKAVKKFGKECFLGKAVLDSMNKLKFDECTDKTVFGEALQVKYSIEDDKDKEATLGEQFVNSTKHFSEHQNNILRKFTNELTLFFSVLIIAFCFTACSKKSSENEAKVPVLEALQADDNEEVIKTGEAETLSVDEESEDISKYYGIMYAKVLDVDTESGPGSRYTLEDKNDPENAWSVTAADIAFIEADMSLGADVVVLYHGDIINDFDNVEVIAMVPEGKYTLGRVEGITTSNQMEQFAVTVRGQNFVFIKDNCHIESEAMTKDHGDNVIVYYADGGENGRWPLRVVKGKNGK